MQWFKRFIQFLLVSAVSFFIASYALIQLAGSGLALNSLIKDTGIYELTASSYGDQLKTSTKIPVAYQTQFEAAVDKSLTASQVEAIIKPVLVDVATWFQQPAGTALPDFVLIIKPAKDKLLDQMRLSGLRPIEIQALETELTQQIPDQITLSKIGELIGDENSSGANSTSPAGFEPSPISTTTSNAKTSTTANKTQEFTDNLNRVKSYFSIVSIVSPISLVVIIISLIGLLWFGRRDGHKWLRRPAWALISASILYVAGYFLIPIFVKIPDEVITQANFGNHLIPLVTNRFIAATFLPAIIALVVGIIFFVASFFTGTKTSTNSPISQLPPRKYL